ncbi:UPF0193 protein EVG1 homolog [Adelges cooleyi]|uniref:UPF0193 protein EVG1 homolog n=1 Tax=Adelges cooleyi TaxID=133065 RepID=UPI00218092DD|nr:UPF0193 protein EVG1 homolog [Adelges cooleyi]
MAYRTKICDEGGLFNASRPSGYSAETRAFLNDLIKESRLTTLQRKSVVGWLRSGTPPQSQQQTTRSVRPRAPVFNAAATVKRYRSSKPRTLKDIIESGAYEPETFVPDTKTKNYSVEKERLQSIMTYGKLTKMDPVAAPKKPNVKKPSKVYTEEELIDSVISEIEDREKFLSDMEVLGDAAKYEKLMFGEILDRIRHLQEFSRKTTNSYRKGDIQAIAVKYQKPRFQLLKTLANTTLMD